LNIAVTTVIAAGIAVLGTLLSPILAQRASARTKAQEYEHEQNHLREEREIERRDRNLAELRAVYTELNTWMRKFQRALNNYLHLIRAGLCNDENRIALDEVRHEYHQRYSDAQMTVSDGVLHAAGSANGALMKLYGIGRHLDAFQTADLSVDATEGGEETIESAFEYLQETRRRIAYARDLMRKELGVASGGN
jgi:hypothetical protein